MSASPSGVRHGSTPFRLICDFDGTLTVSSTLSILSSIGYTRNPDARSWTEITSAYSRDLRLHDETYTQPRVSLRQELEYQDSLRSVERASIERIERAGIFRNVTVSDLARGAATAVQQGKLRMRPGWDRLVKMVWDAGGNVQVVSVNWSRVFIRAAIHTAFPSVASRGQKADLVDVVANDISADGSGRITRHFGGPDGGIWTAEDKACLVFQAAPHRLSDSRTLYVGDSVTDLGCLAAPGVVGIVVRNEPVLSSEQRELRATLERLDVIQVKHVQDFDAHEWSEAGSPATGSLRTLYWARDFEEICQSPVLSSSINSSTPYN